MSSTLRKEFYELFARAANDAGIAWVVLSGIEGYPAGIGRDLDVCCKNSDEAERLTAMFVACLRNRGFRWVVYPSPIWGRRILGITENYAAVELHIVSPVRIGSISLEPTWDVLEYEGGLFPVDPLMRFFKRCLMPAVTRSEAWRRKCAETALPARMPWWMRSTARKVLAGRELTKLDDLTFGLLFLTAHPLTTIKNFARWRVRRGVRRNYPAAPVYQLDAGIGSDAFIAAAERSLGDVFTGFVCVDDTIPKRIKALQATQRLTFLTKPRADIEDVRAIPYPLSGENELLKTVVDEFVVFNKRWQPGEAIDR
jgi:hypothetical protein